VGNDHKRKSRPIAPATVRVSEGCIEVVVPDVLGKNEAHKQPGFGRKGKVISSATQRYRASVAVGLTVLRDKITRGWPGRIEWTQAMQGPWRIEVLGVWPSKRDVIAERPAGFLCPMGDVDAPVSQALDALMKAGILDDDARVVEARAWNMYRKGERFTVIRLVRVPDLAVRDEAIAHLFGLLPPPPPEPEKPKRTRKPRQVALPGATVSP
jgi:Holliday junction resolvase RusA-like endonuclease